MEAVFKRLLDRVHEDFSSLLWTWILIDGFVESPRLFLPLSFSLISFVSFRLSLFFSLLSPSEASQLIFSGASNVFRRPSREASDVGAQGIVEPHASADDGGYRRVRARVRVDGPRPWRASRFPTTRESAAAVSGAAARGGYGCDLLPGCYGCLRDCHRCWTRCGYDGDARRRPQRRLRVTDDVSWSHSHDALAQPRGDSKVVRVQ